MARMFSALRKIVGVLLIIMGFIALITPIPGAAIMTVIGLEMLGLGFLVPPWIMRYWKKCKKAEEQKTEHL